jgi:hypothetical protein
MQWSVDYLADRKLVRVTTDGLGDADRDQLRRLTRDAMLAGHEHGCARFLIDHRLTRLRLGTAEIFDMPRRGDDGGFGHALRIAILINQDSPSRADFEFYAIQCGNLGIHSLRLFFDLDAATDWLQS